MADRELLHAMESIATALNRIVSIMEKDQKDTTDFRRVLIDTISSIRPTDNDTENNEMKG